MYNNLQYHNWDIEIETIQNYPEFKDVDSRQIISTFLQPCKDYHMIQSIDNKELNKIVIKEKEYLIIAYISHIHHRNIYQEILCNKFGENINIIQQAERLMYSLDQQYNTKIEEYLKRHNNNDIVYKVINAKVEDSFRFNKNNYYGIPFLLYKTLELNPTLDLKAITEFINNAYDYSISKEGIITYEAMIELSNNLDTYNKIPSFLWSDLI